MKSFMYFARIIVTQVLIIAFVCSAQRHHGNGTHVMHSINSSHSHGPIDCQAFMQPIRERRNTCMANNTNEVDICVYFASDYNFVIPFLIHHLSLGFSHIWIYNNDEKVAWYRHPAVMCLMEDNYVTIQPWFGENGLHDGLDHCFHTLMPYARNKTTNMNNVWGAVFDIDELFVLHKHTCIGSFVADYPKAPFLAVNWAFYTPEIPLTSFSRTGNPAFIQESQLALIRSSSGIDTIENNILLPHDMLLRRMYENPHVKSISRQTCAGKWENEHCPGRNPSCTFGAKPQDPQGHFINCGPFTPYVDNYYPVAQLNHYWTLSLADFMRKIHRGKGGSYSKLKGSSRHTGEFFAHGIATKQPFVTDTSLHKIYGKFFNDLKRICPKCFDTSLYYLPEK